MLRSVGKRARAAALLGAFAALALAGVATAQSNSQGQGGRPAGPPPIGAPMKGLTYAEFHVQTKSGEAKTIRLDTGKIVSVDSSSITLSENDGSEVTVALDEDTEVIGKPGGESSVEDLEAGQMVAVCGPEGGAAKTVMIAPKKGDLKATPPGEGQSGREGQLPPPPPGGAGSQGQQGGN